MKNNNRNENDINIESKRSGFKFSKHAKQRYSERYIINCDNIDINKVINSITKEDFSKKSSFRKYLRNIENKYDLRTVCYVYDNKVFLVKGKTIVTTWKIPKRFKNAICA